MSQNLDFVQKVKLFNEIAGTKEQFNTKNVSLYMGLVLEEVMEMIQALNLHEKHEEIELLLSDATEISLMFKNNAFKEDISSFIDRKEFLDGAVDVAVVGLGAAISVGADIQGACHEVADSNLSKYEIVNGEYVVIKDNNGKIQKPASFRRPQLGQYLKDEGYLT